MSMAGTANVQPVQRARSKTGWATTRAPSAKPVSILITKYRVVTAHRIGFVRSVRRAGWGMNKARIVCHRIIMTANVYPVHQAGSKTGRVTTSVHGACSAYLEMMLKFRHAFRIKTRYVVRAQVARTGLMKANRAR